MSEIQLRYGFLNNHHNLVKQLELDSLLPHIISKGLITFNENELIKNESKRSTSQEATDKLLTILHRRDRDNSDPTVFQRFIQLLSDPEVAAGQNLGQLVQSIRNDSESQDVIAKFQYITDVLHESQKATLKKHKEEVVQSLSVVEVLPNLVASGVVSINENSDIRELSTISEKACFLLDLVERRGSKAYRQFVKVLDESEVDFPIGQLLRNDENHVGGDAEVGSCTSSTQVVDASGRTVEEMKSWLKSIGLVDRDMKLLIDDGFGTGPGFMTLTKEDIDDMKFTKGGQNILKKAISQKFETSETSETSAVDATTVLDGLEGESNEAAICKRFGLDPQVLDDEFSDNYLLVILPFAKLITDWKEFAQGLGLSPPDIRGIETDIRLNLRSRCTKTLQVWKRRVGCNARYRKLVTVALQHDRVDLAEDFCRELVRLSK